MRPIDADALIEFCAERWIPLNIDAVNMQPTIQPEKEQLYCEGTTSDTISRQWLLECVDEGWIKFDTEKDANRFIHLVRDIAPTAQPVVTGTNVGDTISRQAAIRWVKTECNPYGKPTLDFESGKKVIKHLEQMPPVQPEPHEGHWIRRDCGLDIECKCSVCGYKDFVEPHDTYWFKRNYCPHCGTKMTISTK